MEGTAPGPLRNTAMRVRRAAALSDQGARVAFFVAGLTVFAVLGFILYVLVSNTVDFFTYIPLRDFFGSTSWFAVEGPDESYGIWGLIYGTLLVTAGAALIGLPLGLASAVYLAEYASPRVRAIVKPALELLAGIPSIVFGFFALFVISPWIQDISKEGSFLGDLVGTNATIFSAANAIVVVGIMVIPIITTLSEDAIRAVPKHLREASYGLGATKWETTRSVVVPAALSGITASFVLGVSRAIGESMAVALAAGTSPNWGGNLFEPTQVMTGFIVQRATGDVVAHGPVYLSLFAVGMALFAMTWVLNLVAQRFVRRYREVDR